MAKQRGRGVLSQASHWDPATREVVLARAQSVPEIRFFTPAEAATLRAFCDLVMAQESEPKIPVLEMIDQKLHLGKLDGWRYSGMPDDRDTWRLVARGLDASAAAAAPGATAFPDVPEKMQRELIQALSDGKLSGEVWDELPPKLAWSVVMRSVLAEYYSHPHAWDEIGYGGPAYPRGYARFATGGREPWEHAAEPGAA